jgi:hypothetical protein
MFYDLELLAIVHALDPLEAIPSRVTTQNHHLLRPPKPAILEGTTQDQSPASQGKYSCFPNTTLKFVTSKEQPMEEQMHYHGDQIMTKDKKTTKISQCYQNRCSYEQWKYSPDLSSQEESVLKPWVDPHQLKQHQGTWYKDGRQVVTGGIEAKRHIIQSHHDSPVHGHPGI